MATKEEEEKKIPVQEKKRKGPEEKGYRVSFVSPMYFAERARENT